MLVRMLSQIVAIGFSVAAVNAPAAEPISPLPMSVQVDREKAAIGKMLFVDKRLSKDESLACVSCHQFDRGGSFPAQFPRGVGGRMHSFNSPSIFNAAFNFKHLWSGGAESVEAVVEQVVASPQVFASSWPDVLQRLSSDDRLVGSFRKAYPDGMNARTVKNALAEYTRSLVTPNARFDRYLKGEKSAITADELKGYELFKKYGCVSCHQGINVGGNMLQTFGVMGNYLQDRGGVRDADLGRYNVTRKESDRFVFKVPSLRNVALTAPYFHDGSAATLTQAVEVMFKYQLGRRASEQDVALIIKFLDTLTGEVPPAP
jgi:cytochrome c peroxidase